MNQAGEAMAREFEVLEFAWVVGSSKIRRRQNVQGPQPAFHPLYRIKNRNKHYLFKNVR